MNLAWLNKSVTPEELRADPDGETRWKTLLDAYREGDELWEFCSPPESWQHHAGRSGVSLVRDGAIIESTVSLLN